MVTTPRYKTPIQRKVTEEEAKDMLEKCNTQEEQTFLALCYATGARPAEIVELTKGKFKINEETISIKLHTKKLRLNSQKFEVIEERPLVFARRPPNTFLEIIAKQVQQTREGDRILPYTTRWGQMLLNRLGNDVIGLPLSPYHFRHTAVTNEAAKGRTLDQLMHFKGAKDVRSVIPYVHARPYKIQMEEEHD